MTEEIYERIGEKDTIANTKWPEYDENKTIEDKIEIPVQINGKLKATISINRDADQDEVKQAVNANETIQNAIAGKNVVKEIYVKNKIYNIVVK